MTQNEKKARLDAIQSDQPVAKKKAVAKEKDEDAPKKPLTPFFIYMKKRRIDIKKNGAFKDVSGFAKMVGQEWNDMTAE